MVPIIVKKILIVFLLFLIFFDYILYSTFLIYPHEKRSHQVKKIFYINLEESEDRKKRFLENYNKNPLKDLKPERFKGMRFTGKIKGKLARGQYGCALSHISLLEKISRLEDGWYIVCEDDAIGDYSKIEKKIQYSLKVNPYVNLINFFSKDSFISLGFWARTTCYAVNPKIAKLVSSIMKEKIENWPCDLAIHHDSRLLFQSYNYRNFFSDGDAESVLQKINTKDE